MSVAYFCRFKKFLAIAALAAALSLTSTSAFAIGPEEPDVPYAPAHGCNPTVMETFNRRAEAVAAADRAQIDQSVDQPASTLMQTCFNQAAGVGASEGGNIFGGDFMTLLSPIVGKGMEAFYDDFDSALIGIFSGILGGGGGGSILSALGGLFGGLFGPSASNLQNSYSCDGIKELWKAIEEEGVQSGINIPSIAQMLTGAVPAGAGEKFQKSWQASANKGAFSNAQDAMNALPKAVVPVVTGRPTFCSALVATGAATACP